MKRVEIITAAHYAEKIQQLLDKKEITGYSFWNRVAGKGSKGYMDADGLSKAFQNVYFLIGCSEEEYARIKQPLKELLDDLGGVAMATEAEWIRF